MRHSAGDHSASKRPKGNSLKSLRALSRYLSPYKFAIAGALVALVFTSTAVLGMGSGLRFLVDEGLRKGDPALLNKAYFFMLAVVVLLAVATYIRFYLVTWIGERVVADIRRDVFAHIITMHLSFFETTRTGEILSRLTTDTTVLQGVVGSSVSVALRNILLLVGGMAMLFITSPVMTLHVSFIVPLVVIPIIILGGRVRKLSRDSQDRMADLSALAEESVSGIRTVQALSMEAENNRRFGLAITDLLGTASRRIKMRALLTAIVIVLVFGAISTVLWDGGQRVLAGTLTPGALSAFIFYSVVVAGAVGAISEVVGDLQRAAGATERLMELLQEQSNIAAPEHPAMLPEPLAGTLEFSGVHFSYPSRPDRPALSDFNFSVGSGEQVAIVGPSGAGKTTLFQLLLRFYDPASGTIKLDGVAINTLEPQALRRAVGLVPQDPIIFSANAWDNIRCGRPDATDAEVLQAAEAAAARDFIEKLPEGFNSFLGEKGVRLSGGQRQRIAIARAVIRNPRILLMDEATNALDAESEHLVQQAITRLMKDRTTLVIAHRLSTVQHADKILVMNNGIIEAVGTHKQLMASSTLYARLAALQFDRSEQAA